jgi:Immunity protein 35
MVLRNVQEARGLVERHLAELPISPPTDLAILDEHTIETDFGWVFFWNSRKYQKTGEFQYALAGNTPLIVDRRDGSVHPTSTSEPIEEVIERYRQAHAVAP